MPEESSASLSDITITVSRARRMTLGDGLILIGFTALAFAWARPALIATSSWGLKALTLAIPLLFSWTIAATIARLRRPRPGIQELVRQPGAAALIASISILAVGTIPIFISAMMRASRIAALQAGSATGPGRPRLAAMDPNWTKWLSASIFQVVDYVGPAVLGVWVVLALSGRRRPEAGWIDYFSRIIGGLWIAVFVARLCFDLINRHRY